MPTPEILFLIGTGVGALAFVYLVLAKPPHDNTVMAFLTFLGFAGYTAFAVMAEGPLAFVALHNTTYLGVQVWYDLVIALAIALVFVAPRARAAGMRVPLYVLATGITGNVGLLAMVTRLWWLERGKA